MMLQVQPPIPKKEKEKKKDEVKSINHSMMLYLCSNSEYKNVFLKEHTTS
jgi:hypothetical protein